MSKPDPDPVYVRASVASRCNLDCTYCPVEEGMENRVPDHLAGLRLDPERMANNLRLIAAAGIEGESFTGGEPTLYPELGDLIIATRPYFKRVELTTNGRRLHKVAPVVEKHIDLLKVSLDSLDESRVRALTGRDHAHKDATDAISWALEAGVPLGINVVLMRETLDELPDIIRHVSALASAASASVRLSLLDFYYSPTRRQEWLAGFVETAVVLELLRAQVGEPKIQQRFGCTFYWFDVDGLAVRVKDSSSATMRASKCRGCVSYCQEGVYGLKHSCEGWLTTCPSSRVDLGVHLAPELDDEEIAAGIATVVRDVSDASPDPNSFATMCATHGLDPSRADTHADPTSVPVELTRRGG